MPKRIRNYHTNLVVRLSHADLAVLREDAAIANLNLSKYVRKLLQEQSHKVKEAA